MRHQTTKEVYAFLWHFYHERGFIPTQQEIADALYLARSGVSRCSLRNARNSRPVIGCTLAVPPLARRTYKRPAVKSTSSHRSATSSLARSPWR